MAPRDQERAALRKDSMERYDPYYAQDTDGVHFAVDVDGRLVQGYISRPVLAQTCGVDEPGLPCVAAYQTHRDAIDEAVRRRVRTRGPETVLVLAEELGIRDTAPSSVARLLQKPVAR